MEDNPHWDETAEDVMKALEHPTDPTLIYMFDEKIKVVECMDANGETAYISLEEESEASGPYVIGPFNPNMN